MPANLQEISLGCDNPEKSTRLHGSRIARVLNRGKHQNAKPLPLWAISGTLAVMSDRISIHPKICHGQACVSGTRIPVHQIVRMFAHGDSMDTLLGAYSTITRDDILACLDYAASLAEEQVTPLDDAVLIP